VGCDPCLGRSTIGGVLPKVATVFDCLIYIMQAVDTAMPSDNHPPQGAGKTVQDIHWEEF
jgi:hypothetical protein